MAYLKVREIRGMSREEQDARLKELRQDLMHQRGVSAMGGSPPSPGKIRQLRRQIARILTLQREQELGIDQRRTGKARAGKAPAAKAAAPARARPSRAPAPRREP